MASGESIAAAVQLHTAGVAKPKALTFAQAIKLMRSGDPETMPSLT
jgi:hypothetical protein